MRQRRNKQQRYFVRCKRTKFPNNTKYLFDVPLRIVYNSGRIYCRLLSDTESEFYYAEYYSRNNNREDIHIIEHSISFDIGNELGWIHKNLHESFLKWLNDRLENTSPNDKKVHTYQNDNNTDQREP